MNTWFHSSKFAVGMMGASLAGLPVFSSAATAESPNVIVILADDLGWGDLSCYGAERIQTPNIDRLAKEGRRFTNAYAPTSICSPTRYALLSGRFAWRNERHPPIMVLAPDQPLAFAPGEPTLASLFKKNGYVTAAIGKWHLGFGEGTLEDRFDWSQQLIEPGPLNIGFDTFFGTPANAKNQPHLYIENRAFAGRGPMDEVTVRLDKNHQSVITAWKPNVEYQVDRIAGDITKKAVDFIAQTAERPFFLYYASLIPHKPISPSAAFKGTSECGEYGDYIQELDHNVGSILDALEQNGILDNTLIILTSDNGGVAVDHDTPDFMKKLAAANYEAYKQGHQICGELRGKKHAIYEGGLRVPFIVRWPAHVPASTESDSVLCLTDIYAACANLLGAELAPDEAPDSFNALPLWTGAPDTVIRESVVLNSAIGNYALRKGEWKLIVKDELEPKYNNFGENNNQLYNLKDDPSEKNNLWNSYPEVTEELSAILEKIKAAGHSRSL